jgi:hypothetical protein
MDLSQTFGGESCQIFGGESHWLLDIVPGHSTETLQGCGGYAYEQGELRGAEEEERRGEVRKRMDVPL